MDGKFSELELAFIGDQLDQHGEFMRDLMIDTIEEKNLKVTEELLSSIRWEVGSYGINPYLRFYFPDYGRFIEIRYHKKRSENTSAWNQMNEEANRAVFGMRSRKRKTKKKKDTRWYARNVYGSINRLISILSNEFTDFEKERMRKVIESGHGPNFSKNNLYS